MPLPPRRQRRAMIENQLCVCLTCNLAGRYTYPDCYMPAVLCCGHCGAFGLATLSPDVVDAWNRLLIRQMLGTL